jgi:nucleoid DNA-binding protein
VFRPIASVHSEPESNSTYLTRLKKKNPNIKLSSFFKHKTLSFLSKIQEESSNSKLILFKQSCLYYRTNEFNKTTMSKKTLVDAVYNHALNSSRPITRKLAGELCHTVFETIVQQLNKTGRFAYPGFGVFNIRHVKARTFYKLPKEKGTSVDRSNPANKVERPAHNVVRFRSATALKEVAYDSKTPAKKDKKEKKEKAVA